MVLDRQGKTMAEKETMLKIISPESYQKVVRKMNKTVGGVSFMRSDPLEPKYLSKAERFDRELHKIDKIEK